MSIFEFSNYRDFLRHGVQTRLFAKNGRRKSNITQLARELGYASPSLLSMVLTGKRIPSEELCTALSRSWKLSLKESEYLRLLVELDRRKADGLDNADVIERIQKISKSKSVQHLKEHEFSHIREWHYLVIRQLVAAPDFREDPLWISRQLRKKISPAQAQLALHGMEALGILVRSPEGRLRYPPKTIETSNGIPSASIRMHHRSMILRGLEALEERSVDERVFNSLTMNFDPARMPEIKSRLMDFIRTIEGEFAHENSPAVCQLNLQFFEHTSQISSGTATEQKGQPPHALH